MALDRDAFNKAHEDLLKRHGITPEIPDEPEPPENILDGPTTETTGYAYDGIEGSALHGSGLQSAVSDAMEDINTTSFNPDAPEDNPGVDPEIQAQNEQGHFAPLKTAIDETAEDKNAFFSEQASAIRASSVYREYFYTQPENWPRLERWQQPPV